MQVSVVYFAFRHAGYFARVIAEQSPIRVCEMVDYLSNLSDAASERNRSI